jgi:hypothetical protein
VKDDKGDIILLFISILIRWMNHFPQQLNVYGVNDVGQTEIHTAEKLGSEPSALETEIAIEVWKDMNHEALIKLQQNRSS